MRLRLHGCFAFFLEDFIQDDSCNDADDADQLGRGETGKGMVHAAEYITPVVIAPEKLHDEPDNGIIKYIEGKNLAVEFFLLIEDHQYYEVQEIQNGFHQLSGVHGDIERHSRGGMFIREFHGNGTPFGFPVLPLVYSMKSGSSDPIGSGLT